MTRLLRTFQIVLVLPAVALALTGAAATARADVSNAEALPRPAELAVDIHFWIRVYSEVSTNGGLIHDSRNLGVVYDVVKIPSGLSRRATERWTDKIKARYRNILTTLSKGKRSGLDAEQARVLSLWPDDVSNKELRAAKNRLRFQLGQADKFRAGIIRSGQWKSFIESVFMEHDLPAELAALPHVESSFTPWAYSRVGAAGLWQFTRSTGRRFLRVDHVVDERLDPYRATVAAARLLRQNRQVTGSWPLAITAYNHGASGMRRAVRKVGTRDIATINRKYKSRTFGFASRNFYVELLAANEVSTNYLKYFGPLKLDSPVDYTTFEVPYFVAHTALCEALGIEPSTLEKANPSLRPSVWRGAKYVPRNLPLRVPRGQLARPISLALESISKTDRHAAQTRDRDYRVRRGDTLSTIARRFKVRISELVAINGLRSRHRIRIGQKIKLPDRGRGVRPPRRNTPIARVDIPGSGRYTVRRGDTVSRIATRFGLEESDVLAANRLRNRNRIYVGQTLELRRPETSPSAATAIASDEVTSSTTTAAAAPAPTPTAPTAPTTAPTTPTTPTTAPALAATTTQTARRSSTQRKHHPDAVATLSNPPDRPIEVLEPIQGGVLVAAAEEPSDYGPQTLLADPSDYAVARDDTIEVQGTETLGHYAEWLDIRASRLRRINGMSYGHTIAIGQRIKLDLDRIDADEFETRRQDYHRTIQEAFFERYEIEGTRTHIARRGDSVWKLAAKRYRVPLWLLRQYNPDLDFAALQKGTTIQVPELKQRENWLPRRSASESRAS